MGEHYDRKVWNGMSKWRMAIAGIVLSIICLVLIIINGAIAAQQEHHEEARVQKDHKDTYSIHENEEEYVFTIRDGDGNILMTGGIESARTVRVPDLTGAISYMVEIQFTDAASDTFYQITSEHIGESLGIYLNDEMILNPLVQSAISGGSVQIINMGSQEDAEQLANLLRSTK